MLRIINDLNENLKPDTVITDFEYALISKFKN